jgi:hypothetical protein
VGLGARDEFDVRLHGAVVPLCPGIAAPGPRHDPVRARVQRTTKRRPRSALAGLALRTR